MGSKKDWSVMSMLLPALFQVDQSNKPSILKVIKNILNAYKNMETFAITFKVSSTHCSIDITVLHIILMT